MDYRLTYRIDRVTRVVFGEFEHLSRVADRLIEAGSDYTRIEEVDIRPGRLVIGYDACATLHECDTKTVNRIMGRR